MMRVNAVVCARRVLVASVMVLSLLSGAFTAEVRAAANDGSPLGINLADWQYWSSDLAFLDVMKGACAWGENRIGDSSASAGPLDVDDSGNVRSLLPNQMARNLMLRDIGNRYPGGRYICTYEGEGRIEFSFAARTASREPGRILVDVNPNEEGGVRMMITSINPANPLRNIRFFHESHEELINQGKVFRPDFLKRWEKFKVIRFMDWQLTNDSNLVHWADRPKTTDVSQALGRGVALEHMIDMCNELNADAWFCIPAKADDDFIRQFAIMVKGRLNPGLKCYIEYSNEIWNYAFPQSTWCAQQGILHELVPSTEGPGSLGARLYWQARRSVEMFKIFHEVFGTQKDRVIRVLGAQAAGLHTARYMLDWRDTAQYTDAIAIAPYFYGDIEYSKMRDLTVDEILDSTERSMAQSFAWMDNYVADMKARGIKLITYEGGQHLSAHWDLQLAAKFVQVNRHPRMGEMYKKYLAAWKSRCDGVFVLYHSAAKFTHWGAWGLMDHGDATGETMPKYKAVLEFIEANRTTATQPPPPPARVSVYDLMLARLRAMLEMPGANKPLILFLIQLIENSRGGSIWL